MGAPGGARQVARLQRSHGRLERLDTIKGRRVFGFLRRPGDASADRIEIDINAARQDRRLVE